MGPASACRLVRALGIKKDSDHTMRIPIIAVLVFAAVSILITGFWDEISEVVLPRTTWGLYSKSFFENVLVEAHGAVLDMFIVGVILYWFEQQRDRKSQIRAQEEILADLRLYRAADAPYRVLGTIRRLIALGKNGLQISEMTLSGLDIADTKLLGCNLHATVFTDSRIKHVSNRRFPSHGGAANSVDFCYPE